MLPIREGVAQFPTERLGKGLKIVCLATISAYRIARSIITWEKRNTRLGARRPEDTGKTCQSASVD